MAELTVTETTADACCTPAKNGKHLAKSDAARCASTSRSAA
jgi:hypothetical protein